MATTNTALVRRDAHGRVLKGSTLNPAGRKPSGLAVAQMIRELGGESGKIRAILLLALDIALGGTVCIDPEWRAEADAARAAGLPEPPKRGEVIQPDMGQIQRAQDFIMTWGFQKPAAQLEVSQGVGPGFDYSRLSEAELDQLEALHARALPSASGE